MSQNNLSFTVTNTATGEVALPAAMPSSIEAKIQAVIDLNAPGLAETAKFEHNEQWRILNYASHAGHLIVSEEDMLYYSQNLVRMRVAIALQVARGRTRAMAQNLLIPGRLAIMLNNLGQVKLSALNITIVPQIQGEDIDEKWFIGDAELDRMVEISSRLETLRTNNNYGVVVGMRRDMYGTSEMMTASCIDGGVFSLRAQHGIYAFMAYVMKLTHEGMNGANSMFFRKYYGDFTNFKISFNAFYRTVETKPVETVTMKTPPTINEQEVDKEDTSPSA